MTIDARPDDAGSSVGARRRGPLVRAILVVSILLLAASFLAAVARTRDAQRAALDGRLALAVTDRTSTVTQTFDRASSLLLVLARNPSFTELYADPAGAGTAVATGTPLARAVSDTLLDFQRLYEGTTSEFCFIDVSGRENARVVNGRAAGPAQLSADESGTAFFATALALTPGQVYQAPPYWSADTSGWVISSATPVSDGGGRVFGVLHFETDIDAVAAEIGDDTGAVEAQLVDRATGNVLVDTRYPTVGTEELRTPDGDAYPFLAGATADAGTATVDGMRLAYRSVPVGDHNANDWYLVVAAPAAAQGLTSGLDLSSLTLAGAAVLLLTLGGLTARTHQRRLQRAATSDGLTGLPNRNLLLEVAEKELTLAVRSGTQMALLLLDLDRFKEINDTLGHQWGDRLLREIGPRLQPALRHTDLVARLGGDEFVVLLRDVGTEETALRVAQRIVSLLTQPFQLGDLSCGIEASIGIALGPRDGADVHELLQHADVAMYVAKENRFGVTIYDPSLDLHNPRKLSMLGELRIAIEQQQLELHFQPINALAVGARPGVEALVRWNHPERGLVPPDEFIPLAEHTALMQPITAYVLDRALAQCRRWLDEGHSISMAVNISARSLHDPTFFDLVLGTLQRHGVPPELLDLEITESAIMVDPKGARELLVRLHDLGVRLSIDDFGTGYSSLAYLKTLPVHSLKIDRSFVRGLEADQSDAVIVQSVIDLGRNLGLSVVAEGVEDGPTADHLTRLGCTMGQGWFWSRAQPAADLSEWVAATPALAPSPPALGTPADLDPPVQGRQGSVR